MTTLDDHMDQLVARYSDRLAAGSEPRTEDLLAEVDEEHRPALARCFRMIEAGLAQAPRATAVLGPGVVLGGFRIVRELGRGGMAVVYLAEQLELARKVALKVLRPGLAVERRHVDRFRREALAIARLQHPHIVQVYAVGEDKGWHYLAMELVEGPNLAQVYERLAATPPKARTAEDLAGACGLGTTALAGGSYEAALCTLLAPVARAIGVAHEIGIVHRDVKPSNILIHKDGRASMADFGLAKGDGDPGLSLSGEPLGTPYYMSPEQAELSQVAVDARTDVYSLGVTLYEGLAGRRPFEGASALAVLDQVRNAPPLHVASENRAVSADVDALVARATARAREERYARMLDLASDLGSAAEGGPTQARAVEAGPVRMLWRAFVARRVEAARRPATFEYRSRATLLGYPLVHIHLGARRPGQPARVAKAWLAYGDVAIGAVAVGSCATGGFALGGIATGLFSIGGIALGVLPCGGVALGWLAYGGVALGWNAAGGAAIARENAFGGYAHAAHIVNGEVRDPEAVEYFRHAIGPFKRYLDPK